MILLAVNRHTPCFVEIQTLREAEQEIRMIGSDLKSLPIMAPKAVLKVIKFHHVVLQDSIIIKQDMLSLGGEVAIPKDAFQLKEKESEILLMGTVAQLRELVKKLQRHYPRIQTLSQELSTLLKDIE